MKEAESTAVGRAPEVDSFSNRKLIRPTLNRAPEQRPSSGMERRPERGAKKTPPPEQTHAENFYYQKQIQTRTPMTVVLRDGEVVQGVIEWYDRHCIKLTRNGQPNLLVYKLAIKYMYKVSEDGRRSQA